MGVLARRLSGALAVRVMVESNSESAVALAVALSSAAHQASAVATADSGLVDIRDAAKIVGLSRSQIYKMLADPTDRFPRPVPLTAKRRKFLRAELLAWLADRIAERDRGEARNG